MTGLEVLQSVQFAGKKGKRFAIISIDDWESLIAWLETIEDSQVVRESYAKLAKAKGNREKAGWLKRQHVR